MATTIQNATQQSTNEKLPWEETYWGIFIGLLFLYPFLLWYIWARTDWKRNYKIFFTLFISFVCLLPLLFILR